MPPANFKMSWYRGDSYGYRFKLWQDAEKTQPYDLTGATVKSEVRDKPGGVVLATLTTVIVEPNFVDLKVTPAMSKASFPKGEWDLEITFANGDVNTPIRGPVTVDADVTDSVP